MNSRGALVLVAAALAVGGCSPTADVPATTPTTTLAPSSTTSAPASTTSTTIEATTSTTDRIAEITAIFEDLERRRLAAIYSGDVEAFTALFADTPYLDQSLVVFDVIEPGDPPQIEIEVLEVLRDDETCLAVWAASSIVGSTDEPDLTRFVIVPVGAAWGLAFASPTKEGWMCDGPHPLSG